MKDPRNADVEIALGVGATTATLLEAGAITAEGVVTGMVAEMGTFTGLTGIANLGTGIATTCGALGPIGWAVAGVGGVLLIAHGLYRGS